MAVVSSSLFQLHPPALDQQPLQLVSRLQRKQLANIAMSAMGAEAPPTFSCQELGCDRPAFSTRSNLNRHIQSKYRSGVPMSCGKILQNHTSNIKRHQKSCGKTCMPLNQPLTSDQQIGFESPKSASISAPETKKFDLNFYPGEFGDMDFLIEEFTFQDHQSGYHP